MEIDVDGLKKLTRLTILDLGNNNIGTVPPELGLLTSIRSLTLGNYIFLLNIYLFCVPSQTVSAISIRSAF